jgi:FMN reductase
MEPFEIVAVCAGISTPSSTRLLADRLIAATRAAQSQAGHETRAQVIELRDLATDIAHNMVTGFPSPKLAAALDAVTRSDGLIAATPIFSGSYSGLFKSFFDVIDNAALTGKPVLIAATGGTPRHSLALEHVMRPLFAYLRAVVVPTGVYAASQDWSAEGDSGQGELSERIARAGAELSDFILCRPPSAQARAEDDEVVPFEDQLAALER